MDNAPNRKNWLERNPKKLIGAIVLLAIGGLAVFTVKLRDRKHQRPPDLPIDFFGGSTTECVYVDEDNRVPYLAGRLLERQTHLKVNSYNAGRSGNDTLHCINVLMNKVVNLKPDLVVLMENINDLAILMYDKTYWNHHPSRSPLMEKPPTLKTVGRDLEQPF